MKRSGLKYMKLSNRMCVKAWGWTRLQKVSNIKAYLWQEWTYYCVLDKELVKFKVDMNTYDTQHELAIECLTDIDDYSFLSNKSIGVLTEQFKLTIIDA